MKKVLLSIAMVFAVLSVSAQIENPVKWTFSAKTVSAQEAEITLTATINPGWHIYSSTIEPGGPVATSLTLTPSADFEPAGKLIEKTKPIKAYEKNFEMNIAYFEGKAVFVQKIKLKKPLVKVAGSVEFMSCNDEQCTPPDQAAFNLEIKSGSTEAVPATEATVQKPVVQVDSAPSTDSVSKTAVAPLVSKLGTITTDRDPGNEANWPLWSIFLAGLLGGFAAFFMPCIFPMLPMTISYFTKSTATKGKAIANVLLYALFIIVIYVVLGLLVTILFGADALNNLSTNGIFNLLFFLMLVLFALSFLGAFEITLPSSWVNKTDSKSGNSIGGLFFMAATLSLVSFSCTGPIIGTLLVEAATMGQYLGPAVGMFGFALALSIPFTLFALFPSWLKSMPKSGGWLNEIKVTLGLLELALAFKFLSNVDLAYHWNWFDREIQIALWVVIAALLGFYLLGKIRFRHDSPYPGVNTFRLVSAIVVLAFAVYLVPGLWGAPLRAVSAFLPPQQSQDFDLYTNTLNTSTTHAEKTPRKYGDLFHAPLNLDVYFDYEEGLKHAQEVNKPVLIDFTGHACVNCRKMEADVWSDKEVLKRLTNDFVLIQLYVDDKTELPVNEQYTSKFSGKNIKTIGNKWSDFQASRFNANSQPFYVMLKPDGTLLTPPQGANYNPSEYLEYLESGKRLMKAE